MGDVFSLIEKVENELDEKKAQETAKRLQENKFDMNDLLSQFQQIQKMGSIKSLLSMIPGMESKLRNVDIDDRQMLRVEAIKINDRKRARKARYYKRVEEKAHSRRLRTVCRGGQSAFKAV